MKTNSLTLAVVAVALFLTTALHSAEAQDPLVVNSKTLKLKFENERVRVMEATLPAGAKEQVHSHPAYVIYVMEGGRFRNYAADGTTNEGTFQAGDVLFREPLTHAAENIDDHPMRLLLVELKSESK